MPLNFAAGAALTVLLCLAVSLFAVVGAEDPYRFFDWNVTYGDIYPLGLRQQVCKFRSDQILVQFSSSSSI
jgi:hypothetical protein